MRLTAREPADGIGVLVVEPGEATALLDQLRALALAAETLAARPDCRALLLRLCGAALAAPPAVEPMQRLDLARRASRLIDRIVPRGRPVLAALEGDVEGPTLELALAAHLRTMERSGRLRLRSLTAGQPPLLGGVQRLVRTVGASSAADLLLCGRQLDATTALGIGLVARVLPDGDLEADGRSMLGGVLATPAPMLGACLEALAHGPDLPLDDALELEATLFSSVAGQGG